MKWTIKAKLIFVSVISIAALAILFAINNSATNSMEEGTAVSIMRAEQISTVRDLEHHSVLLTLAAMDAIIDSEADEERINELDIEIDELVKLIEPELDGIQKIADSEKEKELANNIKADLGELLVNVKVNLMGAIHRKAFDEMDVYDDMIDAAATQLAIDLAEMVISIKEEVNSANNELTSKVETAKFNGLITFIIAAIALIILMSIIIKSIVSPLNRLVKETEVISSGDLNARLTVSKNSDEIGDLQRSLLKTIGGIVDKIFWYEQLLDSIPFPISVTDMDMNWTFVNKPVTEIIGKSRQDVVGKKMQCNNWDVDICNTDKCGVQMLRNGKPQSFFTDPGHDKDFSVETTYINDKDGNKIGHIEIVQDITEANRLKNRLEEGAKTLLTEMDKFAKGDLTVQLKDNGDDDIAKLLNGFSNSVQNIRKLIEQVTNAVDATASASAEISASSEEMAAGAQEQSANSSEVAESIEQMTATIIETTQNTNEAAELAKRAGTIAVEGGEIVDQTVEGMNKIAEVVMDAAATVRELGESSDKIGEIVQVIDDIADQTNLLALNAAIEAARAGEQGRGFAVVADEVRKLAERTTKATKEIAEMIKKIQNDTAGAVTSIEKGTVEVQDGKTKASKAGETLTNIINASESVVDVVTQVATASEEQSITVENISKNIEGITAVTNQSAQSLQQVAATAEDLNNLTQNLSDLISQFKISSNNSLPEPDETHLLN
ncbi:MAG: HAMP domain-containing protein [Melioribacteraceae bacterium]|nr:HAMP domain-containing protein [Melioribacteraceae bacterium]